MAEKETINQGRVELDGKFFRINGRKFHPKGVTYGPLAPNAAGEPFGDRERTVRDFQQMMAYGINLIRVYHVPPLWLLDLALVHGLKVFIDIPWNKHLCFLESRQARQEACSMVREAARHCGSHAAVFAFSVVNEVPADIVRWSGATAVARFIDELIGQAKSEAPNLLCTFGNYPPTEYLQPQRPDFHCFNIYLHERRPLENYLNRLQMLVDTKPLVVGELGIDSRGEGELRQAELLGWQIETVFRSGCAGLVLFSYTDEWFKNGALVEDWAFGMTRANRDPKPALDVVRNQYVQAPYYPLLSTPKVSVVVASYNGASTLAACLESLCHLNYPDYEVLLVDDGSTDDTAEIASRFAPVQYIRHPSNKGLGVARNTGIELANGEIVAFTDSDCRADEDWLFYLVHDLQRGGFVGVGGHNLLPSDDSPVAAAVMVSPGGPAHVMLTDRLAEHVPGCNMAFYRWALLEIGNFDPVYKRAGDDVDICWRLQSKGFRIAFSPAGFVWHYRRNTVRAYLRQQAGYGDAEALLERRHPENFNHFGGSMWRGRIYTPAKIGIQMRRSIIYHGLFGTGFFQTIYRPETGLLLLLMTSLEFYALVTVPLLVLGTVVPYMAALGGACYLGTIVLCLLAGGQADIPLDRKRIWSRPLVALLFLVQPLVRGWARHMNQLRAQRLELAYEESLDSMNLAFTELSLDEVRFWAPVEIDRVSFLQHLLGKLDSMGWPNKPDAGWSSFDVELYGSRWARLQVSSVAEYFSSGDRVIRFRFKAYWSFIGRACFWSLAAILVVIVGFGNHPGLWWLFVLLMVAAWRLQQAKSSLLRRGVCFVMREAQANGMTRLTESNGPTIR